MKNESKEEVEKEENTRKSVKRSASYTKEQAEKRKDMRPDSKIKLSLIEFPILVCCRQKLRTMRHNLQTATSCLKAATSIGEQMESALERKK